MAFIWGIRERSTTVIEHQQWPGGSPVPLHDLSWWGCRWPTWAGQGHWLFAVAWWFYLGFAFEIALTGNGYAIASAICGVTSAITILPKKRRKPEPMARLVKR